MLIREYRPDALVVVSADAVYKLDYRTVVAEHLAGGADVTMMTTRVASSGAGRYGVVQVDDEGQVTDYAYKPQQPAGDLVSNEVFVFTSSPARRRRPRAGVPVRRVLARRRHRPELLVGTHGPAGRGAADPPG